MRNFGGLFQKKHVRSNQGLDLDHGRINRSKSRCYLRNLRHAVWIFTFSEPSIAVRSAIIYYPS